MVKRSHPLRSPEYSAERAQRIAELRQQHIGRLFQQAHRAFDTRAVAKLHARGHHGLTLAHTALLANLDLGGTRVTTLAERAGMTKQSMGQLALDLEKRGYIIRTSDPDDRRAMIVTFTDRGWQFLEDAHAIKQEIEAAFATTLGEETFEGLRSALRDLLAGEGDHGR